MTLSELVDLEVQMMNDQDIDPGELRKRDRKIGQQLETEKLTRHDLFLAWLMRVRISGHSSPGQYFETGYRWLGRLLLLLGLITGGGTAAAVLAYDGSRPVNVVNFLAIIIGVQLITIFFFLLNSLPQTVKKLIPGSGDFYNFIRELSYLFSRLIGKIVDHLPSKQFHNIWSDLQTLKIRQKLYRSVEKWLVVSSTQRFGLGFNIGALATCLYLIVFSDLAFAWNTTLDISNQTFHQAVNTIALPWATVIPDGAPSSELVAASRYFRLDAEYINTPGEASIPQALVVGRWWLFLVLSLITYGLIPRVIIFSLSKFKLKAALAKLPFKSADFESLYDRLTRPLLETRALEYEKFDFAEVTLPENKVNFKTEGNKCSVIKWGDLEIEDLQLSQLIKNRFGWKINNLLAAGSLDYEKSNLTTMKLISDRQGIDPILLVIESWEAPDAALKFFIKQLREIIAVNRHIIVGLINKNAQQAWNPPLQTEWLIWKRKIAELTDPYLRVESMVEEV